MLNYKNITLNHKTKVKKSKLILISIALTVFVILFIADIVCSILNVINGNREWFMFNLMTCGLVGYTVVELAEALLKHINW